MSTVSLVITGIIVYLIILLIANKVNKVLRDKKDKNIINKKSGLYDFT